VEGFVGGGAGVEGDDDVEVVEEGVAGGGFDAEVGHDADDDDGADVAVGEPVGEGGAVEGGVVSFAEDPFSAPGLQFGGQARLDGAVADQPVPVAGHAAGSLVWAVGVSGPDDGEVGGAEGVAEGEDAGEDGAGGGEEGGAAGIEECVLEVDAEEGGAAEVGEGPASGPGAEGGGPACGGAGEGFGGDVGSSHG